MDFPKIQEAYEVLKKHFENEQVKLLSRSSLKKSIAKRLSNLKDQLESASESS